ELADERAAPLHGRFFGGEARTGSAEVVEEGLVELVQERVIVRLDESEGRQIAAAHVLRDGVGCASSSASSAERALRVAEEALELVRVRRDARVVEANEDVAPVALGQRRQVIGELPGGGTEAVARRLSV